MEAQNPQTEYNIKYSACVKATFSTQLKPRNTVRQYYVLSYCVTVYLWRDYIIL